MAYVSPNYPSKSALRKALQEGKLVSVFQPGLGTVPRDGTIDLEGPHAPKPHTWYGKGTMRNGVLMSVK